MKFYVLTNDGRKFGPADVPTLNQWVKENRLNRETELENSETGRKVRARDVAGLDFPAADVDLAGNDPILKPRETAQQGMGQEQEQAPGGQPTPYQAGGPQPTQGQSPYQASPQPGSNYPRQGYSTADDGSAKMITNAWILIAVGLFCGCFILHPFAIYQANRAKTMGNPNAQAPLVIAWVFTILAIIGVLFYGIMFAIALSSGGPSPFEF